MRIFFLFFLVILIGLCLPADIAFSQSSGSKGGKGGAAPAKTAKLPDGFNTLKWGTLVGAAKGQVLGKIVFTDDKRIIISRDEEIEYVYGFFYSDPAITGAAPSKTTATEGKLFYVSIRFPYLAKDDVQKSIEKKYGPATGETITNNQGALVWDADKTTIIMWVDAYEKKPFCRKITYLSKDIAKEINEYEKKVFNQKELDVLGKLGK